jgi:2,5-diketo-D-gluconate reductase A
MTSQTQPTVALNDGATMPQFGLGVFQTPPDETERVVKMAVDEGYRLVDTASMYRNEEGVGEALLGRTDVFVTTKLGNSDHGFDETMRAFDESIKKLRRETLDLYLIHWPRPRNPLCRKLEGVGPSPEGQEDLARSASRISIAIISNGSSAKRASRLR